MSIAHGNQKKTKKYKHEEWIKKQSQIQAEKKRQKRIKFFERIFWWFLVIVFNLGFWGKVLCN